MSRRLGAHVRLLNIRSDPRIIFDNMPEVAMAAGVTAQQIENADREAAAEARKAFEASCANAGVESTGQPSLLSTPFGFWAEQVGEIEPLVALAGRVSDLIVVDRPSGRKLASERIFDAAVFSSGRPTLVVADDVPDDLLRHVVIAWNGSLEAARVVGHAISLLHAADRVSIVTATSDRSSEAQFANLQDYLSWHGIKAHPLAVPAAEDSAGAALLAGAVRGNATMMIMGAYTHSRVRQFLLGGVTAHVLKHASIPVLMEH